MRNPDDTAIDVPSAIDGVLQARRTTKVLADEPLQAVTDRRMIEAIVAAAGWAPFHRPAAPVHRVHGSEGSIVPWRFRLLDVAACRALRAWLLARGDAGKLPRLLAGCSALVVVTWLPDPRPDAPASGPEMPATPAPPLFAGTLENMEHLAAAAAAVQSLLIAATARGLQTFWASAGPLRTPDASERLGIPAHELLLGAIFVAADDVAGADTKPGGLRERRGEPGEWSCWIEAAAIADPPSMPGHVHDHR